MYYFPRGSVNNFSKLQIVDFRKESTSFIWTCQLKNEIFSSAFFSSFRDEVNTDENGFLALCSGGKA